MTAPPRPPANRALEELSSSQPTADLQPLSPTRGRLLLQKLRDLDLRSERVEVGLGASIHIDGCTSLDQPAETSVRYRVRRGDGDCEALDIGLKDGVLTLHRLGPEGESLAQHIELFGNGSGPATAPDLKARVDPEAAGTREMTHFLRRLVRAAYAAG